MNHEGKTSRRDRRTTSTGYVSSRHTNLVFSFILGTGVVFPIPARSSDQPATQPTTSTAIIEHAPSGWQLQLPAGWRKPSAYSRAEVEEHWNREGMLHLLPPEVQTPEPAIAPLLILFGGNLVQGKSDTEVVEAFVKHSHISEKIRIMAQSEEKIDQHQAKRFDVKFHRSVPFAPRGQGSADMNAIIYLIRFPERDNVMYFECNEQQASQYEKQLTRIVRLAKVRG